MKILNIEKIQNLKYLKAFDICYLDKKNQEKHWEMVSRGDLERLNDEIYKSKVYADGAMIFATNKDKTHVVVLKEFRVSAGHAVYMLPAGLSDGDEEVEVTAAREFREETGLAFHYVSGAPSRYASIGITNERIHIAYGTYSGEVDLSHQSDEESAEVLFVDREKAIQLLNHEDVCIRTALLLEQFFNLNPFFQT